jgi:hypothetical protein
MVSLDRRKLIASMVRAIIRTTMTKATQARIARNTAVVRYGGMIG